MQIPFFYLGHYGPVQTEIVLNEDTSKHVISVLRMKKGELLNLTDGKGYLLECEIEDDHKKHCRVLVKSKTQNPKPKREISIAISLIKNNNRFEWFLEKVTE